MATVCPEFKVILCGEYGVGKCEQPAPGHEIGSAEAQLTTDCGAFSICCDRKDVSVPEVHEQHVH